MSGEKIYIPKKGDIVWVNFNSSTDKESMERHSALVVSRYEFNRKTMLAIVCPINSTIRNVPTRFTLPEELETHGQVLISHLKTIDYRECNLQQIEHLPLQFMAKIDQIIKYIF